MNNAGILNRVSTQPYRQSIIDGFSSAVSLCSPIQNSLDFGSGEGFFAHHLPQYAPIGSVTPVDVVARASSWVQPQLYDGKTLPFLDQSFDLVYAIDVLHHCPEPLEALAEMARCTSRYLLIKDHNHQTVVGRTVLAMLDELGNRRHGIPSPYHYQHRWGWISWLESHGFVRRFWLNPMPCHPRFAAVLNRLQFIGLWEKTDA